MKTKTTHNNRITTADEDFLYSHLMACAAAESPDALIERFHRLFIDGFGYSDRDVLAALDNLLTLPEIDDYFRFILNRCFHILINRWQTNPQLQPAIPPLIDLVELEPAITNRMSERARSRSVRRLHQVTKDFRQTEQYLALRRLARIIEARQAAKAKPQNLKPWCPWGR